jgi:hypothetical protein
MPLASQDSSRASRTSARRFPAYALGCLAALSASPTIFPANAAAQTRPAKTSAQPRFAISFDSKLSATPLDGRVFVVIATKPDPEPRTQILEVEVESQQVFGADVDALAPGQPALIAEDALGYPTANFRDLPAGDYWVQGVFNKYTTFHRADGHTVKLPMDEGEGQHWDSKPGNFYSVPEKIHIEPAVNAAPIQIHLTKIVPPIEPPKDTEWVKHIRIQSPSLTKFWGHPMYLGAIVVLPEGWASGLPIPTRTTRSSSITATSPMTSPVSAPHRHRPT